MVMESSMKPVVKKLHRTSVDYDDQKNTFGIPPYQFTSIGEEHAY